MKMLRLSNWLMALCLVMSTGLWSCNDEDVDGDEPVLSVEPTALTFAASGSELTKSFELTANREWSIEVTGEDKTWVSVDPLKGEGKATINVTVLPNAGAERSVTLKIVSSINTASVSVVQSPGDGSVEKSVLLDENIGDEKAVQDGTQWPAVNAFTGWKKGGTGATEVTYKSSNASVRANSFSNASSSTSDYSKNLASGGNNIFLKGGATFDICAITLTEAQTKLKLTFGIVRSEHDNYDAPYKVEEFTVALSADGEKWTEPITYTRSDYSSWDLATADFTLSQAATKLYIRFKAVSVDGRIDDITLSTGEGGQTVDLNAASGGGEEEENDGTVENYPTTAVTSFTEIFDAAEDGKFFTSDQWGFYSNDKLYATNSALGWQGDTYKTDKYIAVAPFKSNLSEVTAYAIMAPFDVQAAATKELTFELAWYYLDTPDDSKLEVVASTDFAGNVKTATWTVVKDCSFASDFAKNKWVSLSADLSDYANNNKVYVAFRYTGKGNTYRLDNVAFGTEIGISFGTPVFSGIMKEGTAMSGTKISIPYSHAKGSESYNINVTVSGDGSNGINTISETRTLTAGEGNIELEVTGTPTAAGSVTFTISGIEGLTTNTVSATVLSAEAADYTSNIMPGESNTAEKIYVEKAKIDGVEFPLLKLGSSKAAATYTTGTLPGTGTLTLSFYGFAWTGKTGGIEVTVNGGGTIDGGASKTFSLQGNDGAKNQSPYTLTLTAEEFFSAKLEGVTASTTLTIKSGVGDGVDKRALMVGLNVK